MTERQVVDRDTLVERADHYLRSAVVKKALEEELTTEGATVRAAMRRLTRPHGDVSFRRVDVEHGYVLLVPTGKLSEDRTKALLSTDEQKRFTTITAKLRLDLVRNTHGEQAMQSLLAAIQQLVINAVGSTSAPNVMTMDVDFDARSAMASLPQDKQEQCLDPDGEQLRTYPNPDGYESVVESVRGFLKNV